jgi:pimeloyl-ACP methyl ester carboxylesterase
VRTAAAGLKPSDFAANGFRVIAYDARGHGLSGYTQSSADYRRDVRARDMLALMDALGIQSAYIMGTSMGASTALTLAVEHPDRVRSLILRSPGSPLPGGSSRRQLAWLATSYRCFGPNVTAGLCSLISKERKRGSRMYEMLRSQRRAAVVPMIAGLISEPFYPERLSEIRTRTLIVGQPDDSMHPLEAVSFLQSQLRSSEILVGRSRTHWEDHPGLLRDAVTQFLAAGKEGVI